MKKKRIVSFPHLGCYYVALRYLLEHLTPCEVMVAPPITKRTLELGTKYSPDFVCVPFKYNVGNFIEAAEKGANVFFQSGGGCRFGFYGESQEAILRDLKYDFEFYSLIDEGGKITIPSIYRALLKINQGKLNKVKYAYYGIVTLYMFYYLDRLEDYIRRNIGFAVKPKEFNKVKDKMLKDFAKTKGWFSLNAKYHKYKRAFKKIPLNKPDDCLKVGVIGELFVAMEPFSNYNIEMELAKMGVEIQRFTDLTYIVIIKPRNRKKLLRETEGYLKHVLAGDGIDNVAHTKELCEHGVDGIIHVKPFGCIPEVGAIPIMDKIAHDYGVPIIFLSFDSQTSEEGIRTRLEAFYDMIAMRKEQK